jgi:hypothetical protein
LPDCRNCRDNNPYSDSVTAIVDIKEGQPLTLNLTLTKSFTEKLKEIQNAADGSEIIIGQVTMF